MKSNSGEEPAKAIELIVGDEDFEWDPPPGASKIGGLPNLPKDMDWPLCAGEPLLFLAQIDLAEAAPFDSSRLLPPSGFLWFFLKNRMPDFEDGAGSGTTASTTVPADASFIGSGARTWPSGASRTSASASGTARKIDSRPGYSWRRFTGK